MSRRTSYIGAAVGAAVLFAAPSAALAVSGTIDAPCYSHIVGKGTTPITVTLVGGTPGAPFVLAATPPGKDLGSSGSASGNFDAAGNATAQITDVFPPSASIKPIAGEPVAITVKEFATGVPAVDVPIAQALITNLTMDVSSSPRSPRAKRAIKVSGTPFAGQHLYGFIVHGTAKKVLRRLDLGTADGCGYVSTKGVVAPKGFKSGSYRFYVNSGPALNKPLALYTTFRISRSLF
jgi:hypothetical protein